MMRRSPFFALLLAAALVVPLAPARGIDPVTIGILAPFALRGARIASPYVIRAMQCTGARMVLIGEDMIDVCKLPVGIFQCTLLAPAGTFSDGMQNSLTGAMAPFKLTWDLLLLPLCFFGIGG